jgi:hypothetical protein
MNKTNELALQTWPLPLEWAPPNSTEATRAVLLCYHDGRFMKDALHQSIDDLIRRVRGEYLEMPGLRLTSAQARRLWGLDSRTCQILLHTLLDARFLTCTADGRYGRAES